MNPGPEEFDRLQKLLALKRREAPPPDYFDEFPHRVMARLEHAASAKPSWWERLREDFGAQPVLACAGAVAVVALLVWGLPSAYLSSAGLERARHEMNGAFGASAPAGRLPAEPALLANGSPDSRETSPSTAPMLPSAATNLMWSGLGLRVQPVSFQLRPGGN